ncbi:ATP-binding protein [Streptomyces sp. NPDC003717]|uniref:ATP-binding protein n=1 Tax=Streptomyces sp. NPDC003717 TaxID=3154276 RepID=UPI0033A4C44D
MRHRTRIDRFPVQANGAFTPWCGAKEVSGVALVVAREVPSSSSMAVPHGPAGVGQARHRMRDQLRSGGVTESVIDDAVLVLSELLSNACKHGRPLGDVPAGDGSVRAAWRLDAGGRLLVEVTDGGGPTRPAPSTPSVTARGGRGLNIITALSADWGVRNHARGEVTVWVVVHDDVRAAPAAGHRRDDFASRVAAPAVSEIPGLEYEGPYEGDDAYDAAG